MLNIDVIDDSIFWALGADFRKEERK